MKLVESLRVRWAWRRRFTFPGRREEPAPYGYALPRDGVAPALIALIVVAAIAAGGWLGTQIGGGGTGTGVFDLQPTAQAGGQAELRGAVETFSSARADARHDLAIARSAAEQAAAATALHRASDRAATGIGAQEPALGAALRRSGAAYKALAAAAENGHRRAYAKARTDVAAAERDVERLLGGVL